MMECDDMEIRLLDDNFETIYIIDTYKSFIWTDRYNECGDFEICTPVDVTFLNIVKKGYYLTNSNSEHVMVVETINIESDAETGAYITISGRSLESILNRRIVWYKTIFTMDEERVEPNLQDGIYKLLDENIINPGQMSADLVVRIIPNFIFKRSSDPLITELTFEGEYLGEDLYEVISKLCQENEIGFKLILNANKQLEFSLYAGVDRSYGTEDKPQLVNPYVIFSPEFDNVSHTNYLDSDAKLKNTTLVVGESDYNSDGLEVERQQMVLSIKEIQHTGLDRREIFTDAISMSTDDGYGGQLKAAQYRARLKQKGIDTLMENTSSIAFEGEMDTARIFKYGVDFFMGDIVQVANEYGHEGQAYVSELVMSSDEGGTFTYPTFKPIQKGVYEV